MGLKPTARRAPRADGRSGPSLWIRQGPQGRLFRLARERLFAVSHKKFVGSAYRSLLDREPDDEGFRHFVHDLSTGRTTRELTLGDMVRSAEAAKLLLEGPGLRDHVRAFCERNTAPEWVPPVCFIHMLKCGGSALGYRLSTMAEPWPRLLFMWVDQLVCLPRPVLEQAMLVTGHLPFDAVRLLPDRTVTVTVLRDPVDRTLSQYTHVRVHERQRRLSLETFVTSDVWRPRWVNYQARQLAATVPVDDAWRGIFPKPLDPESTATFGTLQEHIDNDLDLDVDNLSVDNLYEGASRRLRGLHIVGVTDDLDAVAREVASVWGKPAPEPVPPVNVAIEELSRTDVPPALIDEIRRRTEADMQLYTDVRNR